MVFARGSQGLPSGWAEAYHQALAQALREGEGILSASKYTDYSRAALALTALGYDPADVAGYDVLAPLTEVEKVLKQGVSGACYALLALDSGQWLPEDPAREEYIAVILGGQGQDGGWTAGSGPADPDRTAIAIQALTPYESRPEIGAAIDQALACLSALQQGDGGYISYGAANSASCAQVQIALSGLDISPWDSRFVKNGHRVLDALLSYQLADNSFSHEGGGEYNALSTEQAVLALAARERQLAGLSPLYQISED